MARNRMIPEREDAIGQAESFGRVKTGGGEEGGREGERNQFRKLRLQFVG